MYWSHWFVPQLVPKQFQLRSSPPAEERPVFECVGRRAGLGAIILSMFGLDPTVTLTVTPHEVRQRSVTMSGESIDVLPLRQISSVHVSMTNPLGLLIAGIFFGVIGLLAVAISEGEEPGAFTPLVVGIVMLVSYFVVGKKFSLAFFSAGAMPVAIGFKEKKVQGRKIDMARLTEAAEVIRDLISRSGGATAVAAAAPAPARKEAHEVFSFDEHPEEEYLPAVEVVEEAPAGNNPFAGQNFHPSHASPEDDARNMFQRAADLYKAGKKKEAMTAWEEVVRIYPETQAGKAAARNLEKLRGR